MTAMLPVLVADLLSPPPGWCRRARVHHVCGTIWYGVLRPEMSHVSCVKVRPEHGRRTVRRHHHTFFFLLALVGWPIMIKYY